MANTTAIRREIKREFATHVLGKNPFGTTWFVDNSSAGSDAQTGRRADDAFLTIAAAIAAGSAGDTVILSPGSHEVDVSTAALIPLADMQFKGAIPSYGGRPSTRITADADDGVRLLALDVDGTTWENIEFFLVAGGTTALILVAISQTTAVLGAAFINCWFNLNSVDASGVFAFALNDATNATTGLVIKNCRFLGGDATTATTNYIDVGVGGIPDALIEENIFALESDDGDAVGINFNDPGAGDKSYAMTIRNNDFIGAKDGAADSVGIKFAAAMTELEIVGLIRTNYFAYCAATPVTIDKINKGVVWNYVGDNATGGTLVDPGT